MYHLIVQSSFLDDRRQQFVELPSNITEESAKMAAGIKATVLFLASVNSDCSS